MITDNVKIRVKVILFFLYFFSSRNTHLLMCYSMLDDCVSQLVVLVIDFCYFCI
jgi:hypothetical protein